MGGEDGGEEDGSCEQNGGRESTEALVRLHEVRGQFQNMAIA